MSKVFTRNAVPLAEASRGHDNNLNLLRVVAASLVLLSHCFALSTGDPSTEPGRHLLGISLGDISVDIFFVVSGFLVTKSICRSGSLAKYALARGLRILPGLWVALLATALVVCCAFSDVPAAAGLASWKTWHYVLKNGIIVTGADFWLPGAFEHNPFPSNVNASLWTLPLEVWMYITLAVAWLVGAKGRAMLGPNGFHRLVLVLAVVLTVGAIGVDAAGHPSNSLRHASMFFLAAHLFGRADRVGLSRNVFLAALGAIVATAFLPHIVFELAYRLLLPYVVLYLAFVPRGPIRRYNAVGDYSYGIYIYAFPVQQMVASALPGVGAWHMFAVAGLVTLACAAASWHLVENAALRLRDRLERRGTAPQR